AVGAVGGLGHAEIDDLDHAVVRHEQVLGGDIAVNETDDGPRVVTQLVSRVQAATGLNGHVNGDRQGDAATGGGVLEDHAERLAVDPLHHDVKDAILLAQVVNLDD